MADIETLSIRFVEAVNLLASLPDDSSFAQLHALYGAGIETMVREAIAAVEEFYERARITDPSWPERRRQLQQALDGMRASLDKSGMSGEVRGLARTVVETIEPRASVLFNNENTTR